MSNSKNTSEKRSLYGYFKHLKLKKNSQIKINFDGEDLSSDTELLLFKEYLFKIRAVKLINRIFKTNDTAWFRIHKDDANMMQVIYQIIIPASRITVQMS